MKKLQAVATVVSITAAMMSGFAQAQSWQPQKPIRVIAPAAGGGVDTVLRLIGGGIEKSLGQPIIVDNRATSTYPQDQLAKATPDGYQLIYYANQLWLGPFLRPDIPHDPLKDFSPISLTVQGPNTVLVTAELPVKTVKELVDYAKKFPKKLNFAWAGIGSSPHLAGLLFQSVTGTEFTEVRYKGQAQAMIDLAAGRTHVSFPTISTGASIVKGGKARILGVTSEEASPQLPGVPAVAQQGYPDYESVSVHALLGPRGMPANIVNRLNQEVVRFLKLPETGPKVTALGFDVVANSPTQLAAFMKREMDRMGPILKAAGIKGED